MMRDTDTLIASLAAGATPARVSQPYRAMGLGLVAAALYITIIVLISGIRPDLREALMRPLFAAEIGLLILVIVTSLISAVLYSYPDLLQKPRLARVPFFAFGLFVILMAYALCNEAPTAASGFHEMECTACITAYALIPAIIIFLAIRRMATTHARAAGAIAVLTAFSIGALTLRFSEQTDSITHVVKFHYLPILIASIIGIGLGKKLLKW